MSNPIVKIYVELVKKGRKKIDQVPESLKLEVEELLNRNGDLEKPGDPSDEEIIE